MTHQTHSGSQPRSVVALLAAFMLVVGLFAGTAPFAAGASTDIAIIVREADPRVRISDRFGGTAGLITGLT